MVSNDMDVSIYLDVCLNIFSTYVFIFTYIYIYVYNMFIFVHIIMQNPCIVVSTYTNLCALIQER